MSLEGEKAIPRHVCKLMKQTAWIADPTCIGEGTIAEEAEHVATQAASIGSPIESSIAMSIPFLESTKSATMRASKKEAE